MDKKASLWFALGRSVQSVHVDNFTVVGVKLRDALSSGKRCAVTCERLRIMTHVRLDVGATRLQHKPLRVCASTPRRCGRGWSMIGSPFGLCMRAACSGLAPTMLSLCQEIYLFCCNTARTAWASCPATSRRRYVSFHSQFPGCRRPRGCLWCGRLCAQISPLSPGASSPRLPRMLSRERERKKKWQVL